MLNSKGSFQTWAVVTLGQLSPWGSCLPGQLSYLGSCPGWAITPISTKFYKNHLDGLITYALTNKVINKKINNNFMFSNTPGQLTLDDRCLLGYLKCFARYAQCKILTIL